MNLVEFVRDKGAFINISNKLFIYKYEKLK